MWGVMTNALRKLLVSGILSGLALNNLQASDLDPRFTDADGDLVADAPSDPSDWIDPNPLIFAYTPVEDPSVYREVWDDFLQHLEKTTGKKVMFFPVQSNAAQLEAMRAGRLHVTGFNTGSNPIAVNAVGFVPFAMMAAADGSFGYEMELIVPADSPAQLVKDLKGKQIAFTSPTSNSGKKAPTAILKEEFGMIEGQDFESVFSGKHDNSILGVANGDYEAAAIANSVLKRMVDRQAVDSSKIRSIYKSKTFPTTGYGYAYNLNPDLAARIREAFFTFPWEGSKLADEFTKEDGFIPITYQEHWEVIRMIDKANEVSYNLK